MSPELVAIIAMGFLIIGVQITISVYLAHRMDGLADRMTALATRMKAWENELKANRRIRTSA